MISDARHYVGVPGIERPDPAGARQAEDGGQSLGDESGFVFPMQRCRWWNLAADLKVGQLGRTADSPVRRHVPVGAEGKITVAAGPRLPGADVKSAGGSNLRTGGSGVTCDFA